MSIPYGYKKENGKIQINKAEQQLLITFFENYISGMFVADAARDLSLSHSTLRLTLKRSLYLGTDYYPEIIPADLFNTAQTDMRVRSKGRWKKRQTRPIYSCFKYVHVRGPDPVRWIYYSIVGSNSDTPTEPD